MLKRLYAVKATSKKVVHKAVECLGNEIPDEETKSNDVTIIETDENPRNVGKTITSRKKRDKILNKLKKIL